MKKSGFHRSGVWFKICFSSTHVGEQHIFSKSLSTDIFKFIYFKGNFWLFCGFGSGSNCFGVYSYSAMIFIFFVPSILTFDFDSILSPCRAIFGFNVGLKNCFGVHSCSLTTFIFYDSLNSDIWIWLSSGVVFVLLRP